MPRTVLCSACKRDLVARDLPCYSLRQDILRSTWIPSELGASQIEHEIANSSSDIAKYDAEIETLEGVLEELRRKKSELQRYSDERRNLLSPIRKLPNEILGEIFAASCGDNGLLITTALKGKISAPTLVLSHVCSLWRNFVISTPSLWARMNVDFVHAGEKRAGSLVELYLTLSRPAPLTCTIGALQAVQLKDGEAFSHLAINEFEDDHIGIFELFLSEHDRWQYVSLYLHSTLFNTFRIISATCSFPLLETLQIDWEYGPSSYDDHTDGLLRRIMKNSPLLRNLVLFNFYDWFARVVPFEHHQVNSLYITSFCENEPGAVDIFRLFFRLEHLRINIDRIPGLPSLSEINDDVPYPQCHSSTLKALVITVRSMRSSNRVIPSLVLPSLRSLELFFDYRKTQEPDKGFSMQNLKNMLRHSPHIESFKLHSRMDILSRDVLDMLAHVPSLTHLAIEADSLFFDDNFFLDMTLTPPSPTHPPPDEDIDTLGLLPRLKSLDLTIRFLTYNTSGQDAPNPKFIVNMIESRRNIHQQQDDTSIGSDQTKPEQSRIPTTLNELSHFRIAAPIEDSSLPEDEKYRWHGNLSRLLRDRLRVHMDRGLSCTQNLGPF